MKQHERLIYRLRLGLVLVATGLLIREAGAAIPIVDQSNLVDGSITTGALRPGQYLGQSFTPSLGGVDLFDIRAYSRGTSFTQLSLFSGQTVLGSPIATGPIVTITNTSLTTIEFQFPSTVSLVPGALYTARLDLIAGDSYLLAFSSSNPYPGGLAFDEVGLAVASVDWVFSEGLIPEPSSASLLGLGLIALKFRRNLSRPQS
jgi:hypothetical protein